DGDGCDGNCTPTGCGNGVITDAEECDDGNLLDGDGCSAQCVQEFDCGNGVVEFPEQCDDGNAADDDDCDTLCTQTAYDLINGRRTLQAGFVAGQSDVVRFTLDDAGVFAGRTSLNGAICAGAPDTRLSLYPLVDGARGARVGFNDDGAPGDLCSLLGVPGLAAGDYELEIDGFNGTAAPAYTLELLAAMAAAPGQDTRGAIPQANGADVFTLTVAVDDTVVFTSNGAGGCPAGADTILTAYAAGADGTRGVQVARNDDGGGRGLCSQITLPAGEYELAVTGFNNLAVAPYLLSVRAAGVCGDGTVNTGEQCDPGADVPDDFCDGACQFIAGCGNGRVDAGEECDDGNVAVGDGCDGACQREPECGDGFVDAPEQCDDGNLDVGDGCDAACAFEQECGNGVVEGTEACDDGNVANGDGCDAGCTMENFPANRGALFIQADGVGLGARDRFDFVVDTEATVVGQNGSDEALACAGIGDSLMRLYAVNPDGTLG
ncbi:MAG: DVUA0089 family protein, partial [Myxococcales bacterium]|nr:DVUA0089 family protein [Myxococcales bacterium]